MSCDVGHVYCSGVLLKHWNSSTGISVLMLGVDMLLVKNSTRMRYGGIFGFGRTSKKSDIPMWCCLASSWLVVYKKFADPRTIRFPTNQKRSRPKKSALLVQQKALPKVSLEVVVPPQSTLLQLRNWFRIWETHLRVWLSWIRRE